MNHYILAAMNMTASVSEMYVVPIRYSNELRPMLHDELSLRKEGFLRADKVYVTVSSSDVDTFDQTCKKRFFDLINQYENCVTVRLTLPRSDRDTLDRLGIDHQHYPLPGRTSSPLESYSPDAVSEDSLSHLERERALSEGEDEENIDQDPQDPQDPDDAGKAFMFIAVERIRKNKKE